MNHCMLEGTVKLAPTIRYTQDNKTAIAEMEVVFDGLRTEDPKGSIKVVGWGSMAQELQNRIQIGQKLILEGRLRMNTVPRQDGTKEKKAEFTVSKLHTSTDAKELPMQSDINLEPANSSSPSISENPKNIKQEEDSVNWNSSPLVPDTDDIPF